MKDAIDSMPAERSVASEEFANRKLIRPSLNRSDNNHHSSPHAGQHAPPSSAPRERDRAERGHGHSNGAAKKTPPPEHTNAENFYYQKQMQTKTPMILVLHDGEEVRGIIEWYDKDCLKINRIGAPNLMIFKPSIKYMYKESEK